MHRQMAIAFFSQRKNRAFGKSSLLQSALPYEPYGSAPHSDAYGTMSAKTFEAWEQVLA